MGLRKEFNIWNHSGFGQGPSLAFNLYSAKQITEQIAKRGITTTVVETAAEGAVAGSRASWWGAAAGATLGVGLVTWAWWKSQPEEIPPTPSKPQHEIHTEIILLPDDLLCLMNPYDMSFGCLMTRLRIITTAPSKNTTPDPRQTHASASEEASSSNVNTANNATIYDTADLAEATSATAQLLETLAHHQLEARDVTIVLQAELNEISQRITFASTPEWLRERLRARQSQIQFELADAAFADMLTVAPRDNSANTGNMTIAELKWPAPVPIVVTLPADHNPKDVPQEVLDMYLHYAREHEHAGVMLLWNPQENRYELERGRPMAPIFDTSKYLVRTALPVVNLDRWLAGEGLGLTWYFVPTRSHLKLHEQFGLAPSGPIIIDTIMRDATGEAFVTTTLEPFNPEPLSSVDPVWCGYIMDFNQISPNGNKTHIQFLVAYEHNSPLDDRMLLMRLDDVLATPPEGKSMSGFVTPGVDGQLGSEGKVRVHLQRDDATQSIQLEFHSNLMPPTFNYKRAVNEQVQEVAMFMVVEHDTTRTVYRFNSQDLIDILQKTPQGELHLGEESHVIYEKTTGKPAVVRLIDGQIKSITIEDHTEWYDLPINRFTIPTTLPDRQP